MPSAKSIVFFCVWLMLAGLMFVLFNQALNPNKLTTESNGKTVTLKRGPDGHYRAEALINDIKVDVLVDTGATGVAISQRLADKLGLESHIAISTNTANGNSVAYAIRLKSIKLGGVEAKDVSAMIAPGLSGDVLLGMSFLGRMDVRLFQGNMTIKQVEE